jgi:hypothetical protein
MKYTTPPEGHRWHNPENATYPPEGWRFCLEAEVRGDQDWGAKGVPCRSCGNDCSYPKYPDHYTGNSFLWSYIVPDTTPFDIPEARKQTDPHPEDEMWKVDGSPAPLNEVMEVLRDCAYPVSVVGPDGRLKVGAGLTKREWFAGMAMQGILASPTPWTADFEASTPMTSWQDVASGSVQMADALIAALNKKEETK